MVKFFVYRFRLTVLYNAQLWQFNSMMQYRKSFLFHHPMCVGSRSRVMAEEERVMSSSFVLIYKGVPRLTSRET